MEFTGLKLEHFENYREPRSRSNVYSRARLEVKEGMLAASARLVEQLEAAGHVFDVLASDHHPSVWNNKVVDRQFVFFSRGKEERAQLERLVDLDRSLASTLMDPTPYFKHTFLCLCVSGDGFEPAVKLHWRAWVDRDNFLARMALEEEREAILDLIGGLPEEYSFGVEGGPVFPVAEVGPDEIDTVIASFGSSEGVLSVGLKVDPERAANLGGDLIEVASAAFLLLTPVYDLLSWSEEEDFVSLSEREEAIDEARRAVAEQHRQEREAFESRRRERREEQARRFEEERAEKIDHQRYRDEVRRAARAAARRAAEEEAARAAAEEAARAAERAAASRASPAGPPAKQAASPPARRPAAGREPFEVRPGIRVEIAAGVLSGKWGVVQEVDRHGQAKIVLGSMVTRIPVGDLREAVPRRRRGG